MTTPWSPATEPGWRYLHETWSLPVPPGAYVVAGMDVLRGARVSVATRQDLDCWEMFSSVDRPPVRDTRIVPLATLLGVDASLSRTLELAAGESLWRKELGASWHPLRARPAPPRTRRGAHS
jgi:hypothetical protein